MTVLPFRRRPKTLMVPIDLEDSVVVPLEVRGDLTDQELAVLWNAVVLALRKSRTAHGPEQKAWDRFGDLGASLLDPQSH